MTIDSTFHILFSDFLNPSDYPLVHILDKGSILNSLKQHPIHDSRVWNAKKNKTSWLKPLRWIARSVTLVALLALASVATIIKESALTVKHGIRWINGEESNLAHHIGSLGTVICLSAIAATTIYGRIHLPDLPLYVNCLTSASALITSACIGILAADPKGFFHLFPGSEKIPHLKSVFLKYEFGIVGLNGQLLTCNSEDDDEMYQDPDINGHFTHLVNQVSAQIYSLITNIQLRIPLEKKMPTFIDSDGFPEKNKILEYMEQNGLFENPVLLNRAVLLCNAFKTLVKLRTFLEKAVHFKDREHIQMQYPFNVEQAFAENREVELQSVTFEEPALVLMVLPGDMVGTSCA